MIACKTPLRMTPYLAISLEGFSKLGWEGLHPMQDPMHLARIEDLRGALPDVGTDNSRGWENCLGLSIIKWAHQLESRVSEDLSGDHGTRICGLVTDYVLTILRTLHPKP